MSNIHIDYLHSRSSTSRRPTTRSTTAPTTPSGAPARPATGLYTGAEGIKTAAQVADNAASTAGYGGQAGIQADPCYHEWCDTVFNLSQYGLDEFTDVLAHAILSFAGVGTDAVELPLRPEVLVPAPTTDADALI